MSKKRPAVTFEVQLMQKKPTVKVYIGDEEHIVIIDQVKAESGYTTTCDLKCFLMSKLLPGNDPGDCDFFLIEEGQEKQIFGNEDIGDMLQSIQTRSITFRLNQRKVIGKIGEHHFISFTDLAHYRTEEKIT